MNTVNTMMSMLFGCTLILTLYWDNLQKTEASALPPTITTTPTVVTSIKPIHSIVSMLTADLYEPVLLYDSAASVHNAALTPSKVKALNNADLLVWAGPTIETSLAAKMHSFSPTEQSFKLMSRDIPEYTLKPLRNTSYLDMHFWLDINAVQKLTPLVVNKLITLDPQNKAKYLENLEQTQEKLKALDGRLAVHFESVSKDLTYVTGHDSLQYLGAAYNLPEPYILLTGPLNMSSGRDLLKVFSQDPVKYGCVVYESEEYKKIATTISSTMKKPLYLVDASGRSLEAGPDMYFKLMEEITNTLTECMTK